MKQNAVLGFSVDLYLRVVGTHMTLATGLRLPRQRNRCGMTRMARRTRSDRTILIRLADGMTSVAPRRKGRRPLGPGERIGRTRHHPAMK